MEDRICISPWVSNEPVVAQTVAVCAIPHQLNHVVNIDVLVVIASCEYASRVLKIIYQKQLFVQIIRFYKLSHQMKMRCIQVDSQRSNCRQVLLDCQEVVGWEHSEILRLDQVSHKKLRVILWIDREEEQKFLTLTDTFAEERSDGQVSSSPLVPDS